MGEIVGAGRGRSFGSVCNPSRFRHARNVEYERNAHAVNQRPCRAMTMQPGLRKLMLMLHIASSVGLLGAIGAFLALAIVGITRQEEQIIRSVYLSMQLTTRLVIVPLAFASLISGIVQSLGTHWGLLRHYWVLIKLLLMVFATAILIVKIELIDYEAELSAKSFLPRAELHEIGIQLTVHAAGGLLVLCLPLILSIFKPEGRTPFGWRKLRQRQTGSRAKINETA